MVSGVRTITIASLVPALLVAGLQTYHLFARHNYGVVGPVCRVSTREPIVALTLDDGPDREFSRRILRLLQEHRSKATFFVVGKNAQKYSEIVRQEVREGMEIGNHTWSHPELRRLGVDEQRAEWRKTDQLLNEIRGDGKTVLFRAPFGHIKTSGLRAVRDDGMLPVGWSIAVERYLGGLGLSPTEAARAMLQRIRRGEIILAHDGSADAPRSRGNTVVTLRSLIPKLRASGFRVVTVSSLLSSGDPIHLEQGFWLWQTRGVCPS